MPGQCQTYDLIVYIFCVEWNCCHFFLFHLSYICLFCLLVLPYYVVLSYFCLFCLLVLPYYVVNKVEYNSRFIWISFTIKSFSIVSIFMVPTGPWKFLFLSNFQGPDSPQKQKGNWRSLNKFANILASHWMYHSYDVCFEHCSSQHILCFLIAIAFIVIM